jgi:hypothetical protein
MGEKYEKGGRGKRVLRAGEMERRVSVKSTSKVFHDNLMILGVL